MNEKITNLITELALECAKEGLSLSLCATTSDGQAGVAQVGNKLAIEKAINVQVATWFELLEKCGCPGCVAKLAEYHSSEEEQLNPSIDPVDFARKLEKFFEENSLGGTF